MSNDKSTDEAAAFLYALTHDLKAPLRAMNVFADALGEDYADKLDDQGREYLGYITSGARSMTRMIDDLAVYARIGQRGFPLADEDLDIIAADVTAGLTDEIAACHADVTVETPLGRAIVNRDGIALALEHLVRNAITFSDTPEPVVRISSRVEDSRLVLSIADNGIGIAPDFHQRIFDVFSRLNPENGNEGSGIGLPIVRKVMHLHGGDVRVESASGEGAVFSLWLPVRD